MLAPPEDDEPAPPPPSEVSVTYLSGTASSCAAATVARSNAVIIPAARKDLNDTIMADWEDEAREKNRGWWDGEREKGRESAGQRDVDRGPCC